MSAKISKQKVKIAVVIGLFSLAILVFALLLFEGLGTFIGEWINRPVADSYIKDVYGDLKFTFEDSEIINETVERLGIDRKKKTYRYTYVVESEGSYDGLNVGDRFYIDSYNIKVIEDGIYSEYLADRELIDAVEENLLDKLSNFQIFKEAGLVPKAAYYDLCIYNDDFSGTLNGKIEELLDSGKIGDTDCVLHFIGDKVTFDEYKKKTVSIVEFFRDNEMYKPGFLQIVYYYTQDGNEVMQYESQFEFYELDYEDSAIINGADIHYIVELDEVQQTKLKVYNIVKYVYLVVVTLTVIVLSTYWVIKKVRKWKQQDVGNSDIV